MEGWTTVDSRKKRVDGRPSEVRATTATPSAVKGPAKLMDPLQAMDAAWEESVLKAEAAAVSDPAVQEILPTTVPESLGASQHQADSSPRKQHDKTKRASRVKRPRMQTAELPHLEPETVQKFLQQLEHKYPDNDVVQLQALVDHLLVTFRNVQHITLPQVHDRSDACTMHLALLILSKGQARRLLMVTACFSF